MVEGTVELFGMKTEAKFCQVALDTHVYDNGYYLEPEEYRIAALTPERDGRTSEIVDATYLEDPQYWPITIIKFSVHSYGPRRLRHPRDHRTITHTAVYIEEYSGFRFAIIDGITNSGWLYRLGIEAINVMRFQMPDQKAATIPLLLPLHGEDLEDAKREFAKHYTLTVNQGRKSSMLVDLTELLT